MGTTRQAGDTTSGLRHTRLAPEADEVSGWGHRCAQSLERAKDGVGQLCAPSLWVLSDVGEPAHALKLLGSHSRVGSSRRYLLVYLQSH